MITAPLDPHLLKTGDPNPIMERVDLHKVTTLEVDAGWRSPEKTEEFITELKRQFTELGYGHIHLKPMHQLRRGMIIIDSIIYKINTKRQSSDAALRFMKKLKKKLLELTEWCDANCTDRYVIDENGITFSTEADYILYKLRWNAG